MNLPEPPASSGEVSESLPIRAVTEPNPPLDRKGEEGIGKEVPPTAGNSLALVPRAPETTDELVGEWIAHCRSRPPNSVLGQVAKQVKALLAEGIDPVDVRAGLAAWHRKGIHPSTLPSVVNEVMNAAPARASPKPSTTDSRVASALDIAAEYERQEIYP